MAEKDVRRISEDEIAEFVTKLVAWSNDLPEEERGLLQLMLARAASAPAVESEARSLDSVRTAASRALRAAEVQLAMRKKPKPGVWVQVHK